MQLPLLQPDGLLEEADRQGVRLAVDRDEERVREGEREGKREPELRPAARDGADPDRPAEPLDGRLDDVQPDAAAREGADPLARREGREEDEVEEGGRRRGPRSGSPSRPRAARTLSRSIPAPSSRIATSARLDACRAARVSVPRRGFPRASRSSGLSRPWSSALRTRWRRGSPSSSTTDLSNVVSPPCDDEVDLLAELEGEVPDEAAEAGEDRADRDEPRREDLALEEAERPEEELQALGDGRGLLGGEIARRAAGPARRRPRGGCGVSPLSSRSRSRLAWLTLSDRDRPPRARAAGVVRRGRRTVPAASPRRRGVPPGPGLGREPREVREGLLPLGRQRSRGPRRSGTPRRASRWRRGGGRRSPRPPPRRPRRRRRGRPP